MRPFAIQHTLEKKVAAIMAQKGRHSPISLASGLWVISRLYGAAMRIRRSFYNRGIFTSHRLPCFVISVGNLCLGGTGKTPLTVHLALQLVDMGLKTVVVSRGYKGLCEHQGAIVSDGRSLLRDCLHAGDEPFLMANLLQNVPVVVGKDRVAAGRTAIERFKPDVILLDDGFQHQRLERDLNVVLLDACHPFGNAHVLPRGEMREPQTALSSADAVILTRYDRSASSNYQALSQRISPRLVFKASHKPIVRGVLPAGKSPGETLLAHLNRVDLDHLRERRVTAFAGLAHNNTFWDGLSKLGAHIDRTMDFKDHHPYDRSDANRISRAAQLADSNCLVTTDKDYVRLPQQAKFPLDMVVMGISIDFEDEEHPWRQYISHRVKKGMVSKSR